jgi:hypothetical protein
VITGVGTLMFFADPSGNPFGAMHYDTKSRIALDRVPEREQPRHGRGSTGDASVSTPAPGRTR